MLEWIYGHIVLNPGLLIASIIVGFIAIVSQMGLYAKAGQTPWSALVPVWNVVVFCKVVGRPAKHSLFLIIPGLVMAGAFVAYWDVINGLFPIHGPGGDMIPGPSKMSDATVPFIIMGVATIPLAWIVVQMFAEVCDSFGKHKFIDKLLCVMFNGVYILFVLGISNQLYESGWWSRKRGKKYYMPDFKHKGKKFLVTPEKAVGKDDDWKKDKLHVKVVDKKDNSIWKGTDPGDGPELVIEGTANFQKVVERKVLAINEALESGKSMEEVNAEHSGIDTKPVDKPSSDKKEETNVVSDSKPPIEDEVPEKETEKETQKEAEKKEDKPIEAKKGGSFDETKKRFSKKANKGKTKDPNVKTWKDEALEKYRKKK